MMQKYWMLGFFGFIGLKGIPGIINGDWLQATWLVWFVWFVYFIPNSEISLRDVALNFSPSGNITADKRLRNLAGFSVQICFANFFYPQTLVEIKINFLLISIMRA